MTAPTIVQSAFGRGNTSPLTVVLGVAPTAGNKLLMIVTGANVSSTPPSGWTTLESDAGVSASFQGSWTYFRTVVAGDGTSYAVTGVTDWQNVALFETAGNISVLGNGACTGSIVTGALVAPTVPADSFRLLVVEWDTSTTATTPTGWTLLSPTTWQATATGTHDAAIWKIPSSNAGPQTLTTGTSVSSPIWLDIALVTPGDTVGRATQMGAEVWNIGTPSIRSTQMGAEVWNVGTPAFRATQMGAEVWSALPYVPPSSARPFVVIMG